MDMKLEVVILPVSDVDRAKAFYAEQVGFHTDHDVQPGNGLRVVQLTPPGSACSIVIGVGLGNSDVPPGSSKGIHLVVTDISQARQELIERGVAVGEIVDHGRGVKSAPFSDPDGNSWLLQEMRFD